MDLRFTLQSSVNQTLTQLRQQGEKLNLSLQQASTGKRILTPSDDPLATLDLLANQAQEQRLDSFLSNMREANTALDIGVSRLQESASIINEARRIALEAGQGSNSQNTMDFFAREVDSLFTRFLGAANTQQDNRFIFSGTATQTAPFAITASDSEGFATSVQYQGARERAEISVSQQQTVAVRYAGNEVFQQRSRGPTVIQGGTGAAAGTGTSSATGDGQLLVAHTATIYDPGPGSGVAPGAGSAAGDTIIGPLAAHQLNIVDTSGTGASGTVTLDGGSVFNWTSADTNLLVQSGNGASVFVDMSAITPTFSGNVGITANGTLSVDGGASSIAINFSNNQVVTNSTNGAVTMIDSTNVLRTGTDNIKYTGTFDAFQILISLRDDLRNTRNLSSGDQIAAIQGRLSELERVHTDILNVVGEQSTSLQNLDGLETRVRDIKLETRKFISDLEGADITEVVTNLQSQQNQLRLTLAAAARLFDQSLLDFLT